MAGHEAGWVAVDASLPPLDVPVWLHGPRDTWIGCRTYDYDGDEGWYWAACSLPYLRRHQWVADDAEIGDHDVTHWMFLPKVPVERAAAKNIKEQTT